MEGVPVLVDLAEFAVRQVKETGMCMKLDVLGWGGGWTDEQIVPGEFSYILILKKIRELLRIGITLECQ